MDYAEIESPLCESVDEALDEVIDYLQRFLEDHEDEPLSAEEWKAVRLKMYQSAKAYDWKIRPEHYTELHGRIMPVSIQIDTVHLSDRLVQRVVERGTTVDALQKTRLDFSPEEWDEMKRCISDFQSYYNEDDESPWSFDDLNSQREIAYSLIKLLANKTENTKDVIVSE
jgi:hypothetical protein